MKLKREPLKRQALLLISQDEIHFHLLVPPKMTTAEIIAKVAATLGMPEEELLESKFQIEYFDN